MGHDGSHANGGGQVAVAFNNTGQGWWNEAAAAASIRKGDEAGGGGARESTVVVASAVRRLTPRECERLQGFPDDWTAIQYRGKPAADGPRYKALGNSMADPCMTRSEERRVGKECVRTGRLRWSQYHYKKNRKSIHETR